MRSANAARAGGTRYWPYGRTRLWRRMQGSLHCRSRLELWTWLNPMSQTRGMGTRIERAKNSRMEDGLNCPFWQRKRFVCMR
jgi:hypothetical protein